MRKMALVVAGLLLCSVAVRAQEAAVETKTDAAMSKTEIYKELAEKTGLTKDQVKTVLDELTLLAYREAPRSFTIPGLGKLVLVDRAARIGRNPKTGEAIQIPAKKAVKFRVSKACKDAILVTQK